MGIENESKDPPCPTESELAEFVDGGSADTGLNESIKKHIDSCATCRFVVNNAARGSSSKISAIADSKDSKDLTEEGFLPPGLMVDHFEIIDFLGRGGMGEVYLARDTKLGRQVALKCVHEHSLDSDEAAEKFVVEAQTTARFNHPNIVTIHGIGKLGNRPYLALEYLEGETLRQRLGSTPPGSEELAPVALAVALALRESHSHNILHRDLKPENVFITQDDQVRVLDFGLARQVSAVSDTPTKWLSQSEQIALTEQGTDIIAGTPLYLAPELFHGSPISEASDIFAFGVMLFEVVAGYHPFQKARNLRQLAVMLRSDEPIQSVLEVGDIPFQFAEIIDSCLDKDPAKRPSAIELVVALEQLLGGSRTSSHNIQKRDHRLVEPGMNQPLGRVTSPSLPTQILFAIFALFFSWILMLQARNLPTWVLSSFSLPSDSPGWFPYGIMAVICIGLSTVSYYVYRYISQGRRNIFLHGDGFIVFPAICLLFALYHYLILVGRTNTHLAALHSYTPIGMKQAQEMTTRLADAYLQYLDANVILPSGLAILALLVLLGHIFVRQKVSASMAASWNAESAARWWIVPLGVFVLFLFRFVFLFEELGSGAWSYVLFTTWVLTAVAMAKGKQDPGSGYNVARRVLFIGIILTVATACVSYGVAYHLALEAYLKPPSEGFTIGDREHLFSERVIPFLRSTLFVQLALLGTLYGILIIVFRKKLFVRAPHPETSSLARVSSLAAIFFVALQIVVPISVMNDADVIYAYYKFERMIPVSVSENGPHFYIDKTPQSLFDGRRKLAMQLGAKANDPHLEMLKILLLGYQSCKPALDKALNPGSSSPATCITAREARLYCEGLGKRLPTPKEWDRAVGESSKTDGNQLGGIQKAPLAEWTMVMVVDRPMYFVRGAEDLQSVPSKLPPDEYSPKVGFRCAYSF